MRYLVNGEVFEPVDSSPVMITETDDRLLVKSKDGVRSALVVKQGDKTFVSYQGQVYEVERATAANVKKKAGGTGTALAPMPGQIVDVFVEQDEQVEAGQKLLVLEAMKMQHAVIAPFNGVIGELPVRKGDQVSEGQLLVHVRESDG